MSDAVPWKHLLTIVGFIVVIGGGAIKVASENLPNEAVSKDVFHATSKVIAVELNNLKKEDDEINKKLDSVTEEQKITKEMVIEMRSDLKFLVNQAKKDK